MSRFLDRHWGLFRLALLAAIVVGTLAACVLGGGVIAGQFHDHDAAAAARLGTSFLLGMLGGGVVAVVWVATDD